MNLSEILGNILKNLRKLVWFMSSVVLRLIVLLIRFTSDSISRKDYCIAYVVSWLSCLILTLFVFHGASSSIISWLKVEVCFWLLIFLFYILMRVMGDNIKGTPEYYAYLFQWSVALFCHGVFIPLWINDLWQIMIPYFFVFIYIMMTYFAIRYCLLKYLINFWMYFAVFLVLPIISSFLCLAIFPGSVNFSDTFLGWMIIVLTIVLMNLFVYWTPEDRIREARVAVYLILAFWSTVSYVSFLLVDYIEELSLGSLSWELQPLVEAAVRWVTLPYLIGSVFGCFTLELAERNRLRKEG